MSAAALRAALARERPRRAGHGSNDRTRSSRLPFVPDGPSTDRPVSRLLATRNNGQCEPKGPKIGFALTQVALAYPLASPCLPPIQMKREIFSRVAALARSVAPVAHAREAGGLLGATRRPTYREATTRTQRARPKADGQLRPVRRVVKGAVLAAAQIEQQVGRREAATARNLVDAKPRRGLLAVG